MRFKLMAPLVALAFVGAGFGVGVPAASATTGTEHFVGTQTNPDADITSVAFYGPVTGVARDVVVNDNRDRFVFANGALVVNHHRTSDHSSFDPTTCTFFYTEHGTWSVAFGTGAYTGAHGSGTYDVLVLGHACGENQRPDPFSLVLTGAGTLSV
jgi:hypothetical protein